MRPIRVVVLLLGLVFAAQGHGAAQEAREEKPRPHTDQQLKEHQVLETFDAGWAGQDVDERLAALRTLGGWRHKQVLRRLKEIWLGEKQIELLAVAALGLGNQTPFAKDAGKILVEGLDGRKKLASREDPEGDEELAQRLESAAIVAGLKAVADLGYRDGWELLREYVDHHDDDVAGEMMLLCGRLKEYRALPAILEWFNYYPDGMSWSGGSVRVDTGSAGGADAAAAKAKWKAKYGSRKHKARPNAWEKMVQAVEMLTEQKMTKAEELKAWMDANKVLLRKHGV